MSGDVQPRKRKDKKKKKDELGLEEPRGTAAALGEGDVFMHSYSDHGTGGHWCAKIIFFSLLAILVTLIGLIILENRGLSELEANAVESQYSNLLEGWLEDAPDDDHHDEHTLELKHHDDDEDDHFDSHDVGDDEDEEHADEDEDEHADEDEDEHADEDEDEHADEDEDEHADEDEDEQADEDENEDEQADEDETQEDDNEQNDDEDQRDLEEADEDDDDRSPYKYYSQENEEEDDEEDEQDNTQEDDDEQEQGENEEQNDENESIEELENDDNDVEDSKDHDVEGDEDAGFDENEENDEEDEEEHDDHEDEDDELEVEKIEREASEEEPISLGLPALPEEDDDDDDDKDKDDDHDDDDDADDGDDEADEEVDNDDDFLEADVPPVVERVSAPAGKPFKEVDEDDDSTEKPPDTLEEEEEYEKQQEEKRKEEEQSSHHIWLKLSVGAALLAATHAVLRRAAAPRDEASEEIVEREATPVVDRRMTLIPAQAAPPVIPKKEIEVVEEIVRREAPVVKAPPVVIKQDSEEEEEVEEPELEEVVEEEEIEEDESEKLEAPKQKQKDRELYSDEEIEEEEEEEEVIIPKKEAPKAAAPKEPPKPEPEEEEEEDPDDVEIIDDEALEEELEEEEEVSDVDDSELLSRLEAKYGRLPEPERPGQRHKDGGNSVEDMWAGEPADAYWRQQLDSAERDLRQGAWSAAVDRASAGELRGSARARYVIAASLDRLAEARRDNGLLSRAIAAYFDLLEMSERIDDKKLVEIARRTLDRIQFRGNYLKAEPVYRILIRRFPDEPAYRNNLTVSFLMAGRNDLAEKTLKETLAQWPDDRVALVHYAFILKTAHKDRLEEAVELFQKALEGDKGPACEPRFYYHYGDALLLLGRFKEAHEVHERGAKLGHFLSAAQRSLYNVPRLKSHPWWNVNETPYSALARNLEKRWKEILKEGQKAKALFEKEKEGLKERGEWSQMDLFVRGQEIPGKCAVAPVTCTVVKGELAAAGCRRGQVKFSTMAPGTHVRPHVGPTNCRLRMHLGLSNTKDTFLRVDKETRQWQEGKVLIFDDSFEHEVWHNGSAERLVLIVDVWHPDLTAMERRTLPPI